MRFRSRLPGILLGSVLLIPSVCGAIGSMYATPMRGISIEGGLVGVEAGVTTDPSRPPLPFGRLKNPTIYFVALTNETPATVWADVAVRLPGKPAAMKDFGSMAPGNTGYWRWQSFGAVFDQPISVHVTLYNDRKKTSTLADKEMTMQLDSAEKDLLFNVPAAPAGETSIGVLSGWPEMRQAHCKFEGTTADDSLRWDICVRLWEHESVDHTQCEHQVVRAEPLDVTTSALLAAQPEEFRGRADAFHAQGNLKLEKWTLKRCDADVAYEVMMIKAPQGGTDFSVKAL